MAEEEDDAGGIPEWVVTFGDMMSLLLTFFIMLVSLSEMKQEEKFQAMVESFRKQFGHDRSMASVTPGNSRPRNSRLAKLATQGRARKLDIMRGGNKVESPVGDHPKVRIVRPGSRTAIGTSITFLETSPELSDENRGTLQSIALTIGGKPQKIEIRGHTSRRPVSDPQFQDNWQLAYLRARNTMRYLVDELGVDPQRIRIAVAGSNEPVHIGADSKLLQENARVDVFMLDEVVDETVGNAEDRNRRFNSPAAAGPTSPADEGQTNPGEPPSDPAEGSNPESATAVPGANGDTGSVAPGS